MEGPCEATSLAFLEAGQVSLRCSLERGHGGGHYDNAFMISWKDPRDP